MSTSPPSQPFTMAEPIPGYRIQERIGAGGYGEVWRAEAPGGIAKAIKIVYGCHDSERAVRELTALNRIREVRHPFLLSLERMELIDGHMVIVMELATSSLKELFEQYQKSGLSGIPRAELLGYLQDAADALDYMSQKHSLQHLDVKPENLLLVGERIKVADFGLVKDLQDVHSSMISGLTPVYAAPELFDGRPTVHSDQYSLAIVYQEMLTGELPYGGRTTAQLAAQHLHSQPRLDRLPASDQATIARALSKDPNRRFSSCGEMVEHLLAATPNSRSRHSWGEVHGGASPPPVAAADTVTTPVETEVISWDALRAEIGGADKAARPAAAPETAKPAVVVDLPPLELADADVDYRPTVFLGVGGLAAKTLDRLMRRLADRFGDVHGLPAVQMLLFDTDAETLKQVTGDEQTAMAEHEAILLPLRQAAAYRGDSNHRLHWLSRRWIYNIPRSLQTQGLRPLGRLAMVDHMERVMDRVREAIQAAVAPEAVAASAQRSGLPFRQGAPRVFILASISGGTGSGMVLDFGYLVRHILRDLRLGEDGICGILAYGTGRNPQARDLSIANAYALLTELNHYGDLGHAYPGDPACGMPAFSAQDAPFTHTYVVHVGEDLEPDAFDAVPDELAEYLYYNTFTPAGTFFDKCRGSRQADGPSAVAAPMVRTFGLCRVGFTCDDIPAAAVDELCRAVVARWRGTDRPPSEENAASLADPTALLATQLGPALSDKELHGDVTSRAEAIGLNVKRLTTQLQAIATREMGNDLHSYLVSYLDELLSQPDAARRGSHRMPSNKAVIEALDRLVSADGAPDTRHTSVESVLATHLDEMAAGLGAALRDWILGLVPSPKRRIIGAQRTADCTAEYLRTLSREAANASKTLLSKLCSLRDRLLSDEYSSRDWLRHRGLWGKREPVVNPVLLEYVSLGIEELSLGAVGRLLGLVLAHVTAVGDKLRNLTADLNRLAEQFEPAAAPDAAGQSPAARRPPIISRVVAETIAKHTTAMAGAMERAMEEDLHRVAAAEEHNARRVLTPLLRHAARSLILMLLKKVALHDIEASCQGKPHEPVFPLADTLTTATPRLARCGGMRRLLLSTPASLPAGPLAEHFQLGGPSGPNPTVVADLEDNVLLCCEMEQVPLAPVAAAVLDNRFHYLEVASRLYTRTDVSWAPLS